MRIVRTIGGIGASAAALVAPPALAQPALDRVLSGAAVEEDGHCAVVSVEFNFPVRYVSHFPSASGDEVRIRVRAVDRDHEQAMTRREAVRPPESALANVNAIQFDGGSQEGATLTVVFNGPARFDVGQGGDFRSIRVAVNDGTAAQNCVPLSHPVASDEPVTLVSPPRPAPAQSAPPDVEVGAGDPLLAEARAAMTIGDNAHAVALLTRVLQNPDAPSARPAQELLGLARERAGQRAHARAEYEEYLRRYPAGEDADRVRQRLAGLIAADLPERPDLRPAERDTRRTGGARWEANASFSQIYFRDEATYTYEEMFAPTPTTTTESLLHQNELLTALDVDASLTSDGMRARARLSGAYTNDFTPDGEDEGSVSAAYVEIGDSGDFFVTRLGRQTRSTSGIFGRFDGATASVRPLERVRFNVAAGYPVDTPRDLDIDTDRFFYAASVEYQGQDWEASVYRLRQEADQLIDRDAAGIELRYVTDKVSLFTLADYDLHYRELNIGMANGSFTLPDNTTINFGYDYRKAPMLSTINALVGQGVGSLEELRLTYSDDQIEQLALDRTAQASTIFVGLSHPFGERFSFNVDATLSNLDATPASGGVAATEATSDEIYASAQIVGSSLFKEGDLGIIGVRFADTTSSTRYGLDINTRYPVSRALRISPRMRVSYRENKNDDGTQLSARPSVRLNYQMGRRASFEADLGSEWQRNENSMMREESWDYFVTVGYRLDF